MFVFTIVLILGPVVINTYADWLWFGEVGFRAVWGTVILTRLTLLVLVTLVVGGTLFGSIVLAYRSRPVFLPKPPGRDPVEPYRTAAISRRRLLGIGIPVGFGVICGLMSQSQWTTVQLFMHGTSFGTVDPQFGHDVGFYAFDLPFYRFVLNWLFTAILLGFLANLSTHYLFGGVRVTATSGALTLAARVQLAVLAGTLVLLKAVAYWLDRYSLVSSSRKEPTFTGAGYTDVHAILPAKLILLAIAVICAAAFFAAIVLRDLRIPAMATALLVLSSILVGGVWPLLMEQFSVRPNAADVERPYIERNIDATRQAYGIGPDTVEYTGYPRHRNDITERGARGPHDHRQHPAARPQRALPHLHPAATAQELLQLPGHPGRRSVRHRR